MLRVEGLPASDIAILSNLLDLSDVVVAPNLLVGRWLACPYSPFLVGLSDLSRHKLAKKDPGKHDKQRIRYTAHKIMTAVELGGNTFMPLSDMQTQLLKQRLVVDSVSILLDCDKYKLPPGCKSKWVKDTTLELNGLYIQHSVIAAAEKGLVQLWQSQQQQSHYPCVPPSSFNYDQRIAFENVHTRPLSCITGGPGRGKSWVIQQLCETWRANRQGNVVIVSSYNQPLKHLQREMERANLPLPFAFKTIAKCKNSNSTIFCKCEGPEKEDKTFTHEPVLLVVEEAGVCTVTDLYDILQLALNPHHTCPVKFDGKVTIVMVGDDLQLKPIGAGQPFADFIRLYPELSTRLTQNMRIKDLPNLSHNIDAIRDGQAELKEGPDFIWRSDVIRLTRDNQDIFYQTYLSEFNLKSDVVIVAKNETRQLLNQILYDRYKIGMIPSQGWVKGTRVVCRTPDGKDHRVTTGMRGLVVRITQCKKRVTVDCDGSCYTTDTGVWELAYSITTHTAQGCEYDSPYVYSFNDYYPAKDWLYTAVSRAKKTVRYLVPEEQHVKIVTVNQVRPNLSLIVQRKRKLDDD
jgi:exodeoxyribonuclease V alpha subunit